MKAKESSAASTEVASWRMLLGPTLLLLPLPLLLPELLIISTGIDGALESRPFNNETPRFLADEMT
jgi:hypothetical protein